MQNMADDSKINSFQQQDGIGTPFHRAHRRRGRRHGRVIAAVFEKRKIRRLIMQARFAMPFTGQAGSQSFTGAPVGP
jgi:hypothetical protein